jgi:hypothetical protein
VLSIASGNVDGSSGL